MTQEAAVLCLLRSGPKETSEFIGSIYGLAAEYRRAISTLRRKGYVIRAVQLRRGAWRYTLVSEPPAVTPSGQLVSA